MDDVLHHLEETLARISSAAIRVKRPPQSIQLVAVSKTYPAEAIREVWDAGHTIFGESRVQELLAKAPLLPSQLEWHFIGHLQSNKIRRLLPVCTLIHAVDSLELAQDIDRIATELGLFPRVLLEVNVARESSKHGFTVEQLEPAMNTLLSLSRVQAEGLMTIAPLAEDAEASRPHFAALRELRDRLESTHGAKLPTLSMGMSGDFTVAIEEGATHVRIGTAIFGRRPQNA